MSQLANLLTNKVQAFKLGGSRNLSAHRKVERINRQRGRKMRDEIREQRALATSQYKPTPAPQPKPSILRRAMNLIRRAAKVA